jgi:hypothetical protein
MTDAITIPRAKLTHIHTDKAHAFINRARRTYPRRQDVTCRCDLAKIQLKCLSTATDPQDKHDLGVRFFRTMTELSNLLPGEK